MMKKIRPRRTREHFPDSIFTINPLSNIWYISTVISCSGKCSSVCNGPIGESKSFNRRNQHYQTPESNTAEVNSKKPTWHRASLKKFDDFVMYFFLQGRIIPKTQGLSISDEGVLYLCLLSKKKSKWKKIVSGSARHSGIKYSAHIFSVVSYRFLFSVTFNKWYTRVGVFSTLLRFLNLC